MSATSTRPSTSLLLRRRAEEWTKGAHAEPRLIPRHRHRAHFAVGPLCSVTTHRWPPRVRVGVLDLFHRARHGLISILSPTTSAAATGKASSPTALPRSVHRRRERINCAGGPCERAGPARPPRSPWLGRRTRPGPDPHHALANLCGCCHVTPMLRDLIH
jgi:hypothetical protein